MNFSAIRIASKYWSVLTHRNMSDMHAALDSSNAESTLAPMFSLEYETLLKNSRPNTTNLLFHPYLLFFQRRMCFPLLFIRVSGFTRVRWYLDETCWLAGNNFDVPELPMERN